MPGTREQILETAADLFIEHGYEATSLREISEKIGVTKAALYYHFPSKVDILEALVEPAFETMSDLIVQWEQAGGDVDVFGESITYLIDWMLDHQNLFILIDRNIEAMEGMAQRSDSFKAHSELHERMELMLDDVEIPAANRIRMACALGAATGMFTLGGRPPADIPLSTVRRMLVAIVQAILTADLE